MKTKLGRQTETCNSFAKHEIFSISLIISKDITPHLLFVKLK